MHLFQQNVSLLHLNTFKMNVVAPYFSEVTSEEQLLHLYNHLPTEKPLLILGGGSNILFTQDPDAIILHNQIKGIQKIKESNTHIWLRVGAGEVWHSFVLNCLENNRAGLENLSLIPGTVGAAPMQNIGAYGVEVKDFIEEVRFFDFKLQEFRTLKNNECNFGYRESIFKKELKGKTMITYVTFRLNKSPDLKLTYGTIQDELDKMKIQNPSIQDVANAVIQIRSSKLPDPKIIGNGGSFFKNPEIEYKQFIELKKKFPAIPSFKVSESIVKIPAAWLIESAGWKGYRKGNYGVHKNQALVLVNYSDAIGEDILNLSKDIIESVYSLFQITLQREVNIF